MAEPFIGQIILVGFNFAPRGYAMCNGQILSITQNTALFSLLGTMYGGNGQTTFALPDLRGRVPIHLGQGPGLSSYTQGQVGGTESIALAANQMPAHAHQQQATAGDETTNRPNNAVPARGGVYAAAPDGSLLLPTNTQGGNQPHENRAPFLVLNYCIALEGIYPSRN